MIFPIYVALGYIQLSGQQSPQKPKGDSATDQQFKPTPPILPPLVQNPKVEPPVLEFSPADSKSGASIGAQLDVQTAVKIAVALQPSLKIAEAQVTEARGLLIEARSGLYPNLGLTGTYGYQARLGQLGVSGTSSSTTGPAGASGFSTEVQLKQLLFDFGRTAAFVTQAAESAKEAKSLQTKAVQDLAYAVEQQFYLAVQADEQAAVDLADVKVQQDSLDLATGLLKEGQGAPSDVVTAESNLNNSTLTLAEAEANALSAKVTLAALIGIDPRTPLTLSDSFNAADPSPGLPPLKDAVNSALLHRPDFLAAADAVKSNQAGLKGNRLALAPSVALGVAVGSRGDTDPFETDATGASVTVTIPLGDGGLTQGKVEQAKGSLAAAIATMAQVQLQVIQDTSQAYIGVQSALNRQKIAQAGVANGLESLKLAQGRYKAGIGLLLEITTAEAAYLTAQSNLLTANAQLATSFAQYHHAVGEMDEISGIPRSSKATRTPRRALAKKHA